MFTQHTVTVLTAATGHVNLAKCVQSVQDQTYSQVEHVIVIDGPAWQEKVAKILATLPQPSKKRNVLTIPEPTGKDRWFGHRIYAAGSFLCNTEFICFLDEDNWFEPDHVASLIAAMEAAASKWAFALRRIVNESGELVTLDECENLGNLHPTVYDENAFHVDVSCYMLQREVAVMIAPFWYRPGRLAGRMEADTSICRFLMRQFPQAATNLRHTVNYLVGNRPDSVQAAFFLHGNATMRARYPDGMPWKRTSAR